MFMIGLLIGVFLSPFFILGVIVFIAGSRFKKNMGIHGDHTAFWTNFIVFIWGWAEQAHYIVKAFPFFQKDLTETFGIRPDDGRTT